MRKLHPALQPSDPCLLFQKSRPFVRRLEELDAAMAEPSFFSDARRAATLSREHQKLRELIDLHREHGQVENDLKEMEEIMARGGR